MAIQILSDGGPDGTSLALSGEKIHFFGGTAVAVQATAAAGTDAATTQTLANALRTMALNYGLIA
mgnify:CR=1 FL=1